MNIKNYLLLGSIIVLLGCPAPTDSGNGGNQPADTTPPGQVENLALTKTADSVTLTWIDPADADLAEIRIVVQPSGLVTTQTVAAGTQLLTISNLSDGIPFVFYVSAVDESGNASEVQIEREKLDPQITSLSGIAVSGELRTNYNIDNGLVYSNGEYLVAPDLYMDESAQVFRFSQSQIEDYGVMSLSSVDYETCTILGDTLYVLAVDDSIGFEQHVIEIYDLTDLSNITKTASVTVDDAEDLKIINDEVLLCYGFSSSSKYQLTSGGSGLNALQTLPECNSIAWTDDYLFAADNNVITIYDISDPSNYAATSTTITTTNDIAELAIWNDRLITLQNNGSPPSSIVLYDINSIDSPQTITDNWLNSSYLDINSSYQDLNVMGDNIFIVEANATVGSQVERIIMTSDTNGSVEDSINVYGSWNNSYRCFTNNSTNEAIVVNGVLKYYESYKVDSGGNMNLQFRRSISKWFGTNMEFNGSELLNHTFTNGLTLYDISQSTPAEMIEIGSSALPSYGSGAMNGDYYYQGNTEGFDIYDLTDTDSPQLVGQALSGRFVGRFSFYKDYAYCTVYEEGIVILDVSDPRNPVEIGTVPLVNTDRDFGYIHVFGDRLYTHENSYTGLDYFRVFSLTDPEDPVDVLHFDIDGYVFNSPFAVSGDYFYSILNNSTTNATLILTINMKDLSYSTKNFSTVYATTGVNIASGDLLIGYSQYEGLVTFDISDPTDPTYTQTIPFGVDESIFGIIVSENRFMANNETGIAIGTF